MGTKQLCEPLVGEANRKQGFSLLGSIKTGLNGRMSCGLISPDQWAHQGKKGRELGDTCIISNAQCTSLKADHLKVLNDQVISSMDSVFPDGTCSNC